ncbi:hypothetical protein PMAYCL1PPCAC_26385, partial [Pristionchus mayeri]
APDVCENVKINNMPIQNGRGRLIPLTESILRTPRNRNHLLHIVLLSALLRSFRVYNGDKASTSQFKSVVQIQWEDNVEDERGFCSGTAIEKNLILTAGHCVSLNDTAMYKVISGTNFVGKGGKRHSVVKRHRHRGYGTYKVERNGKTVEYCKNCDDIGLLEISPPIEVNDVTDVMRLNPRDTKRPTDGCTVAGWGFTERNKTSADLLWTDVTLLDKAHCSAGLSAKFKESYVSRLILCSKGTKAGAGACAGDSGGALVCRYGTETFLQGIISFHPMLLKSSSYKKNQYLFCDQTMPNFYTDINAYRMFLEGHGIVFPETDLYAPDQ